MNNMPNFKYFYSYANFRILRIRYINKTASDSLAEIVLIHYLLDASILIVGGVVFTITIV